MSKKQASASKTYLNILGIISIVFGALTVLGAIIIMAVNFDMSALGEGFYNDLLARANGDANIAKISLGISILSTGAYQILLGWLERRASKNPEKSTALLVLTVLSVVGGVFTMFNGGFSDFANATGSIVSLTINILALIAIFNVRKTIYE